MYKRTVRDDSTLEEWTKLKVITDVSIRFVTAKLEKGKTYEFVVTATSKFGESVKEEEMIKRIKVLSGKC